MFASSTLATRLLKSSPIPVLRLRPPLNRLPSINTASFHRFSSTTTTIPTPKPVIPRPSNQELKTLFIYAMFPMIGFGLMDNLIMILAGDAIDTAFGVTLGISTLTAAAFGQVFSDISGVLFGGAVERFCSRCGLKVPNLTAAQRTLSISKNVVIGGSVFGVALGCLTGACSLLFIDLSGEDKKSSVKELDTILSSVMKNGDEIIGSQRCSVYFVDEEKAELWSKFSTGSSLVRHGSRRDAMVTEDKGGGGNASSSLVVMKIDNSITGEAYRLKETININDVHLPKSEPSRSLDKINGVHVKSLLAVPVLNREGKVVAVVQFVNKNYEDEHGNKTGVLCKEGFTRNDEKMAMMLSCHLGIFMQRIEDAEEK